MFHSQERFAIAHSYPAKIKLLKQKSCLFFDKKIIFYKEMKVVIPSIHCRDKKMVFSTPRDEFWISWRDIWGEGTWDRYLRAPKLHLVISHTYGQHVLTKVAQRSKIDVFKQFWRQKWHKIKLRWQYIPKFLFPRLKMKQTS